MRIASPGRGDAVPGIEEESKTIILSFPRKRTSKRRWELAQRQHGDASEVARSRLEVGIGSGSPATPNAILTHDNLAELSRA